MFRKIAGCIIGLYVLAAVASAATTEDELASQRILQSVMNVESGYINKATHDSFWRLVWNQTGNDPKARAAAVQSLSQFKLSTISYPAATWKSIRLSYDQKQVVRTPEFVGLSIKLKELSPQTLKAVESAEQFLVAAATRKPMMMRGQLRYVDSDMINQVSEGIEASKSRLDRLLNPKWSEALAEQSIPEVQVTVLTSDLFTVSKEEIAGTTVMSNFALRVSGEMAQEQILYVKIPNGNRAELRQRALNACEGAFRTLGLACNATPVQWKNYPGLRATSATSVAGKPIGIATQLIQRDTDNSILMFTSITSGTAADAAIALEDLLQRIKLQ